MLRIRVSKEANQQITDDDKTNSGQSVPEKLYTAMQVRFREYDIPGHDKARRETETESNDISSYFRRDNEVVIYMDCLFMKDKVDSKELDEDIKYSISTSARQVAKSSGGYDVCKRLMDKINNAYYNASGYFKQVS